MNPLSASRQQPQKQQQKQNTLRMQKHENTLEFHSRLIEAAEVRFPAISTAAGQSQQPDFVRPPQSNQPKCQLLR
jgi:hypothetical protein